MADDSFVDAVAARYGITPERAAQLRKNYKASIKCIVCRDTGGIQGERTLSNGKAVACEIRYTSDGQQVVTGYCECPAGQARKISDEAALAENEVFEAERRKHRLERRWSDAVPFRFRDFRLSTSPHKEVAARLTKVLEQDMDAAGSMPSDYSWYIHGSWGVGKTGLAIGYMRAWMEFRADASSIYIPVPDLLMKVKETYRENADQSEGAVIELYAQCGLLILDDLGAEHGKPGSGWLQDRLYQIINRRHGQMLPTIFTSNLSIPELQKTLGPRITWRIVEMCTEERILHLTGHNLRAKAK